MAPRPDSRTRPDHARFSRGRRRARAATPPVRARRALAELAAPSRRPPSALAAELDQQPAAARAAAGQRLAVQVRLLRHARDEDGRRSPRARSARARARSGTCVGRLVDVGIAQATSSARAAGCRRAAPSPRGRARRSPRCRPARARRGSRSPAAARRGCSRRRGAGCAGSARG